MAWMRAKAELLSPRSVGMDGANKSKSMLLAACLQEAVANFGKQAPMKRPGRPAELATACVMLADPLPSYASGATIAVTGGKPIL
jgi:NAD(P)-dependent dehydrogenase (short-subunit alcohol dehydrogenase family)